MTAMNILVPTDFSVCAERALDYACPLAGKLGATIHVINAIGAVLPEMSVAMTDQMIETIRHNNAAALDKLVAPRRALAKFGSVQVLEGDARDTILRIAKALPADLIVIGTHGRRGIRRALLGSVAEDVLRRAPCPVLTVRSEGES